MVAADLMLPSSAEASPAPAYTPTQNSDGFTQIAPSVDTRVIYVSSSHGSDANDGLSETTPKATLEAGFDLMRERYPDHLLLKRGNTWRAPSTKFYWWDRLLKSGRSKTEPAVLGFYGGAGDRPRIEKKGGAIHRGDKYSLHNFHFIGLEFAAYAHEVGHPEFTGNHSDGTGFDFVGGSENVLVEDCKFTHSEIAIQPYDVGGDGAVDNTKTFKLRRNIFTGAYANTSSKTLKQRPSNIFIAGTEGFFAEENVFDSGGWNKDVKGASSNQFNHNVYLQYEQDGNQITFLNNIITRGSSLGIHGRPGGLYEDNFFARNAIGLQMGYKGKPLPPGRKAIARNNVISEGETMIRQSSGCLTKGLCTGAVWGLNTEEYGSGYFELDSNIVSGVREEAGVWQERGTTVWASAFGRNTYQQPGDPGRVEQNVAKFDTNIEWDWSFTPARGTGGYVDPGRVLSDYNESLGGANDFDEFMNIVLDRPLQTWYPAHEAQAINAYIRAGFAAE